MGLRSLEIFSFFQHGNRRYTSESAVYRGQILTYKDGPRADRVIEPLAKHLFRWNVSVLPYINICSKKRIRETRVTLL